VATRAQKAAALLGYIRRGPALDLTFIGLDMAPDTPPLTSGQRLAIESDLRRRYENWADTWPAPLAIELLAKDLAPKKRKAAIGGTPFYQCGCGDPDCVLTGCKKGRTS
jgi:hypothetical protein